jgi:hypothetical protein
VEYNCATICLDNILLYSPNLYECEKDFIWVMQAVQDNDCHIRLAKYELAKDTINFIGFEYSKGVV